MRVLFFGGAFAALLFLITADVADAQSSADEARARAQYEQGLRELHAGNGQAALDYADSARGLLGSDNPRLAALRVQALVALERWEDAQAAYEVFFSLNPNTDLAAEIADLTIQIDQEVEAGRDFQQRRTNPLDPLGRALIALGACNFGDAEACVIVADALLASNDRPTEATLAAAAALDRACILNSQPGCDYFSARLRRLQYSECDTCMEFQILPRIPEGYRSQRNVQSQLFAISARLPRLNQIQACHRAGFCRTPAEGEREAQRRNSDIFMRSTYDDGLAYARYLGSFSHREYGITTLNEYSWAVSQLGYQGLERFTINFTFGPALSVITWMSQCELSAQVVHERNNNCDRFVMSYRDPFYKKPRQMTHDGRDNYSFRLATLLPAWDEFDVEAILIAEL